MRKIVLILVFLTGILLYVITSVLRSYSIILWLWITPVIYAFSTYLILQKVKTERPLFLLCAFLVGINILDLSIRLTDFEKTLSTILCPIIGTISIIATYLYQQYPKKALPTVAIGVFIWAYAASAGQMQLLNYKNYGRCPIKTGLQQEYVYKTNTDSVRIDELNHQYIVLDFWNSSCGVCFKMFPELQQLYNKFQNRENILISSVFVKYNTDKTLEKGVEIIRKIGYTFPVYAIKENSSILSLAGIKVYPTVLILDKDKKVIFKGSPEKAIEKLNSLVQ